MKDTESYVNKAEVKRKIKAWLDYRQSRQVTDGLLDLIEKLPVTVKGQLETTLESNWISVKDRLPEDEEVNQPVVVLTERGDVGISRYCFFRGVEWDAYGYKVTHWLSIPKIPKGE